LKTKSQAETVREQMMMDNKTLVSAVNKV